MGNYHSVIENKLLAQDRFLELDRLLNRFNVFEATDMARREIKHTKFLCYLLDPNESHGLGEAFIRRFVTLISEKYEKFPNIMDLDFSFAKITAEKKFSSEKNKSSLDCLIEIPLRGQSDKAIIIAIENKLDSKQGEKQLEKYGDELKNCFKEDDLYKFYLVFNKDEEPNDETWKVITYSNVVLPAVEYTIEILEDKGALHLKETLNDYLVLLREDEDGDKAKEQLANQLIQLEGIKSYLEENVKKKSFGSIYIKHKKVIDYLCQLDQDPRTKILDWWNKLKPIHYELINDDGCANKLILKHESSIRSYLRFSVLSESNRKNLTLLSHPDENWLDSKCPISFEITLRLAYKKAVSDQPAESTKKVNCSATLVLGPLAERVDRPELFNKLYSALQLGGSGTKSKAENFTGRSNRLISTRKNEWVKGKPENVSDPIKWIEDNILTNKDNVIDLNRWIKELAVKLNQALDEYFESSIKDIA